MVIKENTMTDVKVIYSKDKNGNVIQFSAELIPSPDNVEQATIKMLAGRKGGKLTPKDRFVKEGKNLGKANATTINEQAEFELERLYRSKYEKGYCDRIEDIKEGKQSNEAKKPQGALVYWEEKHKLLRYKYVYVQPKLNGIRCLIKHVEQGVYRLTSRSAKGITDFPLIQHELDTKFKIPVGATIDCEIYLHDPIGMPFDKLKGLVLAKKNLKEERNRLQAHVYDYIIDENNIKPYEERKKDLDALFDGVDAQYVINTETIMIELTDDVEENERRLQEYHDTKVFEHYEGIMLRLPDGTYNWGHKTIVILKFKVFHDKEFKVIDIYTAENDDQKVMFKCITEDGKTFNSSVEGKTEHNYNEYYLNREKYIGKWVNIRYQAWGSNGVPYILTATYFREGQEINGEFVPDF